MKFWRNAEFLAPTIPGEHMRVSSTLIVTGMLCYLPTAVASCLSDNAGASSTETFTAEYGNVISKEEMRSEYNWNGEMTISTYDKTMSGIKKSNGSMIVMASGTHGVPFVFGTDGTLFGALCVGNLQVSGQFELTTDGMWLWRGSTLTYPRLSAAGSERKPAESERRTAETLIEAVQDGDVDQVNKFLSQSVSVNSTTDNAVTPLMIAAYNGFYEIVMALIEKGADVSAKDSYGRSALTLALEKQHQAIADALIAHGADMSAIHKSGKEEKTRQGR